ncbi:MAG: NAD(P)-dependent oxidoreductase [Candidatus Binatia bacterium]
MDAVSLDGKRIVVTGPAGQVAFPIVRMLASRSEVFGLARFSNAADRQRLEALGVRCVAADLAGGSLAGVPEDVDYVLHFAVVKNRDANFDRDVAANAEGAGRLMSRCRRAKAFLHCSSTGVYAPAGHRPLAETDPLGDNHAAIMPTYSLAKIATESVVRFCAREWGIPTTIARLNVPYGDNGGWPAMHLEWMLKGRPVPVHTNAPSAYNPIHEDDYVAHVPRLLAVASVPATVLNWAGTETVSIEEWCRYMGELTGVTPQLLQTDRTIASVVADTTRMVELVGPTRVPWREGMRRLVASRHPERLRAGA